MPDAFADCPMAHMITIKEIKRDERKYDDLAVVCYINSTAEIKQYADVCVTSSNAVKSLKHYHKNNIFFIPRSKLRRFCKEDKSLKKKCDDKLWTLSSSYQYYFG